jgi:hypothetical protein
LWQNNSGCHLCGKLSAKLWQHYLQSCSPHALCQAAALLCSSTVLVRCWCV